MPRHWHEPHGRLGLATHHQKYRVLAGVDGFHWLAPAKSKSQRQMTRAHTGLVFLAFLSDLTASSWAFLFSASLLACEKGRGTQARVREEASKQRGVSSLTRAVLLAELLV